MSYVTLREYELLEKKYRELKRKYKKQEKVIDLMSQDRAELGEPAVSAEAIKEFYFRKAENEKI